MSASIRPAVPDDLPQLVTLLMRDAEARRSLDPLLWALAADAPTRIERTVQATLNRSELPARELWLVAEHAGRIVGTAHAMMLPVPPIYDSAADSPGLLLDDCIASADAPPGTSDDLLAATEAALRAAGATILIASHPAAGPWHALYERHGYEPVTLYMAKHKFDAVSVPPEVRAANVADVPGIVARSAEHRKTLSALNRLFWHIHPDADQRFGTWMRRSLTLNDRDMFIATASGEVHGYIIAQPASALLIPAAHEIASLGVVDDFYDDDFADVSAVSNNGSSGGDLLTAAESAFARRAVHSAIVVCPAAWPSKVSLLQQKGYRTAKLWMLKR